MERSNLDAPLDDGALEAGKAGGGSASSESESGDTLAMNVRSVCFRILLQHAACGPRLVRAWVTPVALYSGMLQLRKEGWR